MTAPLDRAPVTDLPANNKGRDRTHWLYLAVIFAVIAGVIVGLTAPSTGKSLTVLGTVFVNLIKMMIAPVIFCTIVLGIGSVRKAAAVGKVGGLALAYFLTMSSVALGIGLIVGNLLSPGRDLHLRPGAVGSGAALAGQAAESHGIAGFIQQIIPRSLPSALTEGNVLQVLLVALLVGFAVQGLGPAGESILRAVENLQKLVFKVLVMVLWLAPIGAFGAIANIVATTGFNAVTNLLLLMAGFYLTCVVFVFGVLGVLLRIVSGLSIFRLLRYLAREYLLIFATSSSEVVLPRLITKMKHLGVQSSTVGVVVPTGYSFNLDGTAIYLTMASLFIADAMGHRLTWGEQIALLAFMIIASKGAAGVSGGRHRHCRNTLWCRHVTGLRYHSDRLRPGISRLDPGGQLVDGRHDRRHHRHCDGVGGQWGQQGFEVAVEHQYGAGRRIGPVRVVARADTFLAAVVGAKFGRLRPVASAIHAAHRAVLARRLARRLDYLLLGLVDQLGSVCRDVHRADFAGTDDPGVHRGGAARSHRDRLAMVYDLR